VKQSTHLGFRIRLGRGIKTDAERAAAELRSRNGLSEYVRLPAIDAAAKLGIEVKHPHEIPGMSDQLVSCLEDGGADKWSAVFIPFPPPHKPLIIHNRAHSERRQESNVFHELGHLLCDHEPDKIITVSGLSIREFSREKEDQADAVGQALHLPKIALLSAKRKGLSTEEICVEFCASEKLVTYRMNITGINKMFMRMRGRA
jgi:Zn-dependent peptidase ImmA (M78 family)